MENEWTKEIDRLRAENIRLAAELAMANERIRVMEAWMHGQVKRIREATKRGDHG